MLHVPASCRHTYEGIILSKELVKCKLAVNNPGHLDKLYELCRAGGLAVHSYEKGKYFTSVQYRFTLLWIEYMYYVPNNS